MEEINLFALNCCAVLKKIYTWRPKYVNVPFACEIFPDEGVGVVMVVAVEAESRRVGGANDKRWPWP